MIGRLHHCIKDIGSRLLIDPKEFRPKCPKLQFHFIICLCPSLHHITNFSHAPKNLFL